MRLKSFTAPSIGEAMSAVRAELGDDAIIVATRNTPDGGVRVTAALEPREADASVAGPYGTTATEEAIDFLRRALDYHGVPVKTSVRLLDTVRARDVEDKVLGLGAALDDAFHFAPLPALGHPKPLMLVGPPGAGKTVSTAKLAARAALAGHDVAVATADTTRAGGVQQLSALTGVLGIEAMVADTPERLFIALNDRAPAALTLIDTPGTNPFDKDALDRLGELVACAGAEPVLVLAAGMDAREAAETARAFAAVEPTRLLCARLDAARRLGGLIAAAEAGGLAFCDAGTSPSIAQGLAPLNPVGIARLLLREPRGADADLFLAEAAQ